uniref:Uncharacterized protein n=1 Tax=Trichuris muris TaxID=70415 RepID=A0A5S6R5E0_TRIMR
MVDRKLPPLFLADELGREKGNANAHSLKTTCQHVKQNRQDISRRSRKDSSEKEIDIRSIKTKVGAIWQLV